MATNQTNISLRDRVNYLLQESGDLFSQLIKNSFDMIILMDAEGIQHYVSDSCIDILGFNPEELIGIDVIEAMIHPEDKQKTIRGFKNIVNNREHGGTQYRHRHKNGDWVFLEAFGNNQLENPAIGAVVLNVRDITERKKAEEALIESQARLNDLNATKDKFFSIIGHDLKNPFAGIIGLSELLLYETENKNYENVREYAEMIHHSSNKAMELLTNLLLWAKTQRGRYDYKPEYFNLKEAISEEADLLRDAANLKSISIEIEQSADLSLFADKAMIQLVIRNLISNGIKFSHSGETVQISAEKNRDEIIVHVADNGVGIDPGKIEMLFKIESRYSTIGTNKEMGTGLGLLLCTEFIELHNGKIWAESEPGKGSVFSFSIPVVEPVIIDDV